jgi:hypothetical protein
MVFSVGANVKSVKTKMHLSFGFPSVIIWKNMSADHLLPFKTEGVKNSCFWQTDDSMSLSFWKEVSGDVFSPEGISPLPHCPVRRKCPPV